MEIPENLSIWVHKNGCVYRVLFMTNEHSQDLEKYPVTVVYEGINGRLWSRPLNDWHRSLTKAPVSQDTWANFAYKGE